MDYGENCKPQASGAKSPLRNDGNIDAHGMDNGFTRWLDGWIYACHGYRNTSHVQGSDGQPISMNSGNGYRFR